MKKDENGIKKQKEIEMMECFINNKSCVVGNGMKERKKKYGFSVSGN